MNRPLSRPLAWSDAQLTEAIPASSNWVAVMRLLGYGDRSKSAGAIRIVRRRAVELGLDTSHFRGKRRWTDPQLRQAVAEAHSWEEVLTRLGLSPRGGSMQPHIKAHTIRLGLNIDHLSRLSHLGPSPLEAPPEMSDLQANLRFLRVAGPAIAASWFAIRDRAVSFPIEPTVYDLLVDAPSRTNRVQVKTTTTWTKNGWTATVGHHPDTHARKGLEHRLVAYDPEFIDLFFVIDGDMTMYLIPSRALAGRVRVLLRTYKKYIVGNAAGLLGVGGSAGVGLTGLRWRRPVVWWSDKGCGSWLTLGLGLVRWGRSSGCRWRRCCRSRCRTGCLT